MHGNWCRLQHWGTEGTGLCQSAQLHVLPPVQMCRSEFVTFLRSETEEWLYAKLCRVIKFRSHFEQLPVSVGQKSSPISWSRRVTSVHTQVSMSLCYIPWNWRVCKYTREEFKQYYKSSKVNSQQRVSTLLPITLCCFVAHSRAHNDVHAKRYNEERNVKMIVCVTIRTTLQQHADQNHENAIFDFFRSRLKRHKTITRKPLSFWNS